MNVNKMTLEKFDALLPTLQFSLLDYPARYAYEGAGPRCLIASTDDFDVLFENGEYCVVGFEDELDPWNVMFTDHNDERIEL